MACLFCRIVAGEVPAAFVHEDAALVAFLDIAPTDITSLRYIEAEALRFRSPPRPSAEEMARTAAALRAALEG